MLGDVEKAKHDKTLDDSRASTTIVRCASTAESTGPTNFVMQGTKLKEGYTEKFLFRHGAAPGSSFAMSPSAFMTCEAWLAMALKRAKGIRAMPVICDQPDCWAFELEVELVHTHMARSQCCG